MKLHIINEANNTFRFVTSTRKQTEYNLAHHNPVLLCEGPEDIIGEIYVNLLLFNKDNPKILNDLRCSLSPQDINGQAIVRFRGLCRKKGECLLYEGPRKFRWSLNTRKETTPHRFAYLMLGKNPPDILQVYSTCEHPNCVAHLDVSIRKMKGAA